MDGYVLSKAFFSESEQTGILAALQQLSATQYPDTQPVIDKLKGIFVKQTADWLEVDFTHWGSGAADKAKLSPYPVRAAEQTGAALYLFQRPRRDRRAPGISAEAVFQVHGVVYFSAYCTQREDYRLFKLSRMRDASLADRSISVISNAGKAAAAGYRARPRIAAGPDGRFCIHPRQAHRVYDEFRQRGVISVCGTTAIFSCKPPCRRRNGCNHYLLTFGARSGGTGVRPKSARNWRTSRRRFSEISISNR